MKTVYEIAVIVGSLRLGGITRALANSLARLAPPELRLNIVEIGTLPLYDSDAEGSPAADRWTDFRAAIRKSDGVLFVTPEYNRSVPGALKNAIDVGSRPYGQSAWAGKSAAVVSQSPGAMGGFGANHAIRQGLVFLDMPTLQQPEAYLGHAGELFGPDGDIRNADTRAFLEKFLAAFARWVALNASTRPALADLA